MLLPRDHFDTFGFSISGPKLAAQSSRFNSLLAEELFVCALHLPYELLRLKAFPHLHLHHDMIAYVTHVVDESVLQDEE